jgi:NADH:ubiquinone oxidoreductase subunit B-like Fe-S oxidoreductase
MLCKHSWIVLNSYDDPFIQFINTCCTVELGRTVALRTADMQKLNVIGFRAPCDLFILHDTVKPSLEEVRAPRGLQYLKV